MMKIEILKILKFKSFFFNLKYIMKNNWNKKVKIGESKIKFWNRLKTKNNSLFRLFVSAEYELKGWLKVEINGYLSHLYCANVVFM